MDHPARPKDLSSGLVPPPPRQQARRIATHRDAAIPPPTIATPFQRGRDEKDYPTRKVARGEYGGGVGRGGVGGGNGVPEQSAGKSDTFEINVFMIAVRAVIGLVARGGAGRRREGKGWLPSVPGRPDAGPRAARFQKIYTRYKRLFQSGK